MGLFGNSLEAYSSLLGQLSNQQRSPYYSPFQGMLGQGAEYARQFSQQVESDTERHYSEIEGVKYKIRELERKEIEV